MPGVPVRAIARRRVIERLLHAGAVSESTAQPLPDLSWLQRRALQQLVDGTVIRTASTERYFLNPPALADYMARRRLLLLLLIGFIAVAAMFLSTRAR